MIVHFIDSSSLSKLFLFEDGSIELRQYIATVETDYLSVCSIAKLELCSALNRRLFLKHISVKARDYEMARLEDTLSRVIQVPVDNELIDKAVMLIERHRVRSLDALQLASAVLTQNELDLNDRLLFIASDRRLLEAAVSEGLQTWNPDDKTFPAPVN